MRRDRRRRGFAIASCKYVNSIKVVLGDYSVVDRSRRWSCYREGLRIATAEKAFLFALIVVMVFGVYYSCRFHGLATWCWLIGDLEVGECLSMGKMLCSFMDVIIFGYCCLFAHPLLFYWMKSSLKYLMPYLEHQSQIPIIIAYDYSCLRMLEREYDFCLFFNQHY